MPIIKKPIPMFFLPSILFKFMMKHNLPSFDMGKYDFKHVSLRY